MYYSYCCQSFLLAIFFPALQWQRSSVEPGSSYNRQDEIVSLVRQLTLEVCLNISSFAHLYCSFQLRRQYKQKEAAGERIRCSFSPDRKSHADKKVRIQQLRKFLCFLCAFKWENSHTCTLLSWRLELQLSELELFRELEMFVWSSAVTVYGEKLFSPKNILIWKCKTASSPSDSGFPLNSVWTK